MSKLATIHPPRGLCMIDHSQLRGLAHTPAARSVLIALMTLRMVGSGLWSWLLLVGALSACVAEPHESSVVAALDLPPHAAFSVVCIDRTCTVDAEASSDDVFIASYRWSWGDGETTTGGSSASAPSHTYASFAGFTITLTVTDGAGQTASTVKGVTLVQGPTAAFTFLCSSFSCLVNASTSTGPAAITAYHWDWGDETTTDVTTPTTVHTYAFGTTFQAHLTVTDANGRSAGVTRGLTVPIIQ
jgi:PKD repeat protein